MVTPANRAPRARRRSAKPVLLAALLGLALAAAAAAVRAQAPGNIQVNVNSVSTPVVVRDSKGVLQLNLNQANFRVFDNGVAQRIETFDLGGAPVSAAIVVDTSSRVEGLLPEISRTGTMFTQTVIGADGDAAVIGYNDNVDTLQGFTSDPAEIEKAFSHLTYGTDGEHLYDAMARGVALLRARPDTRRRVLITLAESNDTGSEAKLGIVLRDAQLANIVIYSIGLSTTRALITGDQTGKGPPQVTPPGTFSLPPMPGTAQTPDTDAMRTGNVALTDIVEQIVKHADYVVRGRPMEIASMGTGGLFIPTFGDASIAAAVDTISGDLHAQYMITYRPTGAGATDYHQIRVELIGKRGLKVRWRPGYFLEAPARG